MIFYGPLDSKLAKSSQPPEKFEVAQVHRILILPPFARETSFTLATKTPNQKSKSNSRISAATFDQFFLGLLIMVSTATTLLALIILSLSIEHCSCNFALPNLALNYDLHVDSSAQKSGNSLLASLLSGWAKTQAVSPQDQKLWPTVLNNLWHRTEIALFVPSSTSISLSSVNNGFLRGRSARSLCCNQQAQFEFFVAPCDVA